MKRSAEMKLLLVACLVAVCSAAPPVPNIPQTFCGSGEIFVNGSADISNYKFLTCRDYVNQMEVGINIYKQLTTESLLRYDQKTGHIMGYIITGPEQCTSQITNITKLPPIFDWVKSATYEGQKKIKEMSYDIWGQTVAGVRLELAVAPGTPNVPAYYTLDYTMQVAGERFELAVPPGIPNVPGYYNGKETDLIVEYNFMSFNVTISDPKVFDVPPVCKKP